MKHRGFHQPSPGLRDYSEVSEDGTKLYTSRRYVQDLHPFLPDVHRDFAEITVRAKPCQGQSEVVLSPPALASLREAFGEDFERQRDNVRAAVKSLIAMANVKGDVPHVGASSFQVEVTRVRVSRNAGQDLSAALLTAASWAAMGAYLEDYETEQQARNGWHLHGSPK